MLLCFYMLLAYGSQKAGDSLTMAWWLNGRFGVLRPQGRRFESHSSRHIETLASPSLVVVCITWSGALYRCLVVKVDSCNNLLSSIHTLLVSILLYVRLHIKMKILLLLLLRVIAFRSSRGFMHMKIVVDREGKYILGQFSQPFVSIPQMIQYYTVSKLPIKGAEHMSLLYPVIQSVLW